jgi:hypothetical protein
MDSGNVYNLEFWIGKELFVSIPMWHEELILVTLCGVEPGGVWLESQFITIGRCRGNPEPDDLDDTGKAVVFVPYHQISYILRLGLKDVCHTPRARLLRLVAGTSGDR